MKQLDQMTQEEINKMINTKQPGDGVRVMMQLHEQKEAIKESIVDLSLQISELECQIKEFEQERVDCEDAELYEDGYKESLNEEGPVAVCGMHFNPADILESLDPTAYRCGLNDFADSLIIERQDEIDEQIEELNEDIALLQEEIEELEQELEELESEVEDV